MLRNISFLSSFYFPINKWIDKFKIWVIICLSLLFIWYFSLANSKSDILVSEHRMVVWLIYDTSYREHVIGLGWLRFSPDFNFMYPKRLSALIHVMLKHYMGVFGSDKWQVECYRLILQQYTRQWPMGKRARRSVLKHLVRERASRHWNKSSGSRKANEKYRAPSVSLPLQLVRVIQLCTQQVLDAKCDIKGVTETAL